MSFLSQDKLTIVGAGGMIGSNMAQTAAMMRLTPNICLYDPFLQGLEGVAEEIRHCGFEGLNLTFTNDIKEALSGAKYVVSSGGAPRKEGMTREDLLKGNCEIAAQLGKDIKAYAPDLKHLVIIFNPADITGLVALIHSGLKPSQVTTLAALDSTRLQSELAKHFGVNAERKYKEHVLMVVMAKLWLYLLVLLPLRVSLLQNLSVLISLAKKLGLNLRCA